MRAFVLLLSTFVLAGCGGDDSGGNGKKEKKMELKIAVIPKGTSHDFWLSVRYGAEKAAKDLSVDGRKIEILWQGGNDETDKSEQKQIVETMIGNQVDGICLAPIDSDAFVDVTMDAEAQGVPVVVFDSGLSDFSHVVSYVATDNEKGGVLGGNHLAELVKKGDRGDGVIMLRYQAGSESTELREKGFVNTVGNSENDLLVLSEDQRINSDAAEAVKVGESLLREHGDNVAGVFTVCEPNNEGMLQALENEGLAGKVVFVGFDSSPRMIEGLEKGTVHGVVLQDPVRMGELAVKTMVAHLDGEEVDDRIDTGVHLATLENMNEEPYKSLLHPKQAGKDD